MQTPLARRSIAFRARRHASRIGAGTLALACGAIGAGAAIDAERLHHHDGVPVVAAAPEEPRPAPDRAQDAVDQLVERLRRDGRTAAVAGHVVDAPPP